MTTTADDDIALQRALDWLERGQRTALATVIATWGSSPRPPGSLLAVSEDGAFVGSVSGGCIEGAVIEAAQRVMAGAKPTVLEFGVSDDRAWQVGLACGGTIEVFVEPLSDPELLRGALERRPVALVTDLANGDHALVRGGLEPPDRPTEGSPPLHPDTLDVVRAALRADECRRLTERDRDLFIKAFNPPLRMIIIGAVHIAQALAPMATHLGFALVVVDPRQSFGSDARFPDVTLSHDWPDAAMADLEPDARTAVVTLSHDPKLDDPALDSALRSEAFYIGALGSQKTQALRRERLTRMGFSEDDLARIHGPVGLDLGGREAREIALAILAEVVAARHGRPLGKPRS